MKGKEKVLGLNAKRSLNNFSGRKPADVIKGTTIKNSDVDIPTSKGKKPKLNAKSKV